jgi:hypothetical protein
MSLALILRDGRRAKGASLFGGSCMEAENHESVETDPSEIGNPAKFGAGSKEEADGSDRR